LLAVETHARTPDRGTLAAIVQAAGTVALRTFCGPLKSWTKGGSSPVCEADIAVNDFLRARLMQATPDFGWLSEESEHDSERLGAPLVWVVDPIDGTRAYMAGDSTWAISVALVESGRPIMAALFAPADKELFLAVAGQGATLNDAPIAASDLQQLAGARLAGPKNMLRSLSELGLEVLMEPRVPSLALRIARVAQGRYDAAFASSNSHDWDLAAADLLVHEAGGAVTTFAGQRLIYNKLEPVHGAVIAAGRTCHQTLIELMRHRAESA
jgi:myo-inositol-1(or 4)-monophosphatase